MRISGQEHGVSYLEHILDVGKVPPAILVYGPPGSGKGFSLLRFAGDYLCLSGQGACGSCISCTQFGTLRHPDFIYFSARPIALEISSLLAAADKIAFDKLRVAVARFLYKTEKMISAGLSELKKTSGKKGKGSVAVDGLADHFYEIERKMREARDHDTLKAVLEEALLSAQTIKTNLLPVAGVRKIIGMLGKRPLLSGRRLVLIEGAELLRQEAANAFLKTLEEPPRGTVIVLTASDIRKVLPTIKSRCALVPFKKIKAAEMEQLVQEEYGIQDPLPAAGIHWLYDYFRQYDGSNRKVHELSVLFFELIDKAEYEPKIFDFFKEIADQDLILPFLEYLQGIIADTLLARELSCGEERILVRMLNGYGVVFLRQIASEIQELLNQVKPYNLSPAAVMANLFMGFYQAGRV